MGSEWGAARDKKLAREEIMLYMELMGTPNGSLSERKVRIIPIESRPAYVCPDRDTSRLKATTFSSDLNAPIFYSSVVV